MAMKSRWSMPSTISSMTRVNRPTHTAGSSSNSIREFLEYKTPIIERNSFASEEGYMHDWHRPVPAIAHGQALHWQDRCSAAPVHRWLAPDSDTGLPADGAPGR